MGVYVSDAGAGEKPYTDVKKTSSSHDFGKDIVPAMVKPNRVLVYGFREPVEQTRSYWRDAGTLSAFTGKPIWTWYHGSAV